jgi:hypothetical protein
MGKDKLAQRAVMCLYLRKRSVHRYRDNFIARLHGTALTKFDELNLPLCASPKTKFTTHWNPLSRPFATEAASAKEEISALKVSPNPRNRLA